MVENRVWRKEGIDGRLFAPSAGGYPDDKIFVDKDNSLGGGAGRWYRRYYNVTETVTVHLLTCADSWVDAWGPNNNHGGDTRLHVRGTATGQREAILKFKLTDPVVEGGTIPSDAWIIGVDFYIYVEDSGEQYDSRIYTCHDAWDEYTVTWNNKPAYDANPQIGTLPLYPAGGWRYCSLDAGYFRSQFAEPPDTYSKQASFFITMPWAGSGDCSEYSRETGAGGAPNLIITYARERLYNIDVGVTGALRSR